MNTWAKPGAKCVCVLSSWGHWAPVGHDADAAPDFPANGDILVIVEVLSRARGLYLGFAEYGEACFHIENFKPVVDQSDDVALFVHHLERAGERA
ncbi:MAG: hypothetical protein KIT02_10425 [Devosia sp.]|uniref:hypothetical protein n=1 Tax=Devosia sp. TaxID=1871048 RepID=UPI0024CAA2DD|nr:hypothetical protein [Devosia sp.]UYN98381.1 MAG: hypothetical protein KIT02_10425 [Devosia sp.]